jgi:dihydrofolate reductase
VSASGPRRHPSTRRSLSDSHRAGTLGAPRWHDLPLVNDGIESALSRARTAAGGRDIRIGGGADLIQQYRNAGLVNEFTISIAPVVLGEGTRLFDCIKFGQISLEVIDTVTSPRVTHLATQRAARAPWFPTPRVP